MIAARHSAGTELGLQTGLGIDYRLRGIERTGDIGFGPPVALSRTEISEENGAKSSAQNAPSPLRDPDLTLPAERWPTLPEHIQAAINALAEHTQSGSGVERNGSIHD